MSLWTILLGLYLSLYTGVPLQFSIPLGLHFGVPRVILWILIGLVSSLFHVIELALWRAQMNIIWSTSLCTNKYLSLLLGLQVCARWDGIMVCWHQASIFNCWDCTLVYLKADMISQLWVCWHQAWLIILLGLHFGAPWNRNDSSMFGGIRAWSTNLGLHFGAPLEWFHHCCVGISSQHQPSFCCNCTSAFLKAEIFYCLLA